MFSKYEKVKMPKQDKPKNTHAYTMNQRQKQSPKGKYTVWHLKQKIQKLSINRMGIKERIEKVGNKCNQETSPMHCLSLLYILGVCSYTNYSSMYLIEPYIKFRLKASKSQHGSLVYTDETSHENIQYPQNLMFFYR